MKTRWKKHAALIGGIIAAGYCIEMYDDVSKYPNGLNDENYYSEIWIPVRKK